MIFCKKNIALMLAVGFAFTANNAIATNSVQKVKKVKQNFISGIALYESAVYNFTKYAFQINGQPERGIAKRPDVGIVKSIYCLAIDRSSPANVIAAYNVGDSLPKNGIVVECWNYGSATALMEASSVSNSSCGSTTALKETPNISNSSYDSATALKEASSVSNSSCNAEVAYQHAIQSSVSNSSCGSTTALTEASSVSNSSCNAEVAYQHAIQSSIAAYHNSGIFSLDSIAYKMAFDQENSLVQPAAEMRSCVDGSFDLLVLSLGPVKPQISFYNLVDKRASCVNAFEYAVPDCVFGGCSVLPVDGVKDNIVGLANRVSGVAYSEAFDTGISYLNFISKLDNKYQQPIIDKKTVLRSFYGISDLDMTGMTRNDDSSWLSIPAQCRFRALQKIQNGEDPSEEFMAAALWQQREEDQALALETNRYVVVIQGIVDMKSVSYESDVVIGFEAALNKIKIGASSIKLDGGKTAFDGDSIKNIIRLIRSKQLMADVVRAKAYSKNAGATFTFKIIRSN